jgi:hypothetical protein
VAQPSNDPTEELPPWARRGIGFGVAMMVMLGVFQVIAGLTALFDDRFFVVAENYAFDLDPTFWGWIHLLLGIVFVVAGVGLARGVGWARDVAILLAMVSAVVNFLNIPSYPFWSLLVIGLNVWVIFSLTRLAFEEMDG